MTLPYFLPETLPGALDLPGTIDHCEDAQAHTIRDYKGLPRFEALLCILGDQATQLENAFQSLLQLRGLDTANDVQLDQLGRIVGEPRKDRTDASTLSSGSHPGEPLQRPPKDLYPSPLAFPVRALFSRKPSMAIQVVCTMFSPPGPFVLFCTSGAKTRVSLAFGWLPEAEEDSFIWNDSQPLADLTKLGVLGDARPLWGGVA